ncbi:hypothetical protein R3P38DRAFT_3229697 [Favolaschia claudopus]|uniref:Uncharacterized protein n=1 Tax=Favolaschia claudopus TaxID=2862362 RepID=A0AAV9ZNJ6_9AGAR
MLVAWRVKECGILRLIGALSDLHLGSSAPPAVHTKPTTFFAGAVRNLSILGRPLSDEPQEIADKAAELVPLCTGIQNLDMYCVPFHDHIAVLGNLRPTRLAMESAYISPNAGIPATHPFFSQVTHLQLGSDEGIDLEDLAAQLPSLPCLTHISGEDLSDTEVSRMLAVCVGPTSLYVEKNSIYDRRYVRLRCGVPLFEWQVGVHTGKDYWSRAEEIIASRLDGELHRV